MMLFREKQQILIFALAAIIISSFVLFRYLPLQKKLKTIDQSKHAQRIAAAKASAQQDRLPALKEQLLKLQSVIGDYQASIPVQRTLGEFLHKIAESMNKHNLTEQMVQPGEEIKAGQLKCIPVNMKRKGKLAQIFEFYKQLQGLDRLVRIEHIRLENEKDFSGIVSMQTKTVIFYRPDSEQG